MTGAEIVARRLRSQLIATTSTRTPVEVVRHLCALQAQDNLASLWAVALRTPDATEADIDAAFARRELIRTWPMRGTIHTVAVDDARWMTELMAPRVLQRMAKRHAELGVDTAALRLGERVLGDALAGGRQLTRPAATALLAEAGMPADERRNHVIGSLSMRGVLCLSGREGKQQTIALLDECAPSTPSLPEDEALARLALRYFTGHGPAALPDLMWWSGLPGGMLKRGIAAVANELEETVVDGTSYWSRSDAGSSRLRGVHLLASFDEYLVGYRDRTAALDPVHTNHVTPGSNGIFNPIVVIDGRVRGSWRRTIAKGRVVVAATPFEAVTERQRRGIGAAAERYAAFLGLQLDLTLN
jgi:hypothetical protein